MRRIVDRSPLARQRCNDAIIRKQYWTLKRDNHKTYEQWLSEDPSRVSKLQVGVGS